MSERNASYPSINDIFAGGLVSPDCYCGHVNHPSDNSAKTPLFLPDIDENNHTDSSQNTHSGGPQPSVLQASPSQNVERPQINQEGSPDRKGKKKAKDVNEPRALVDWELDDKENKIQDDVLPRVSLVPAPASARSTSQTLFRPRASAPSLYHATPSDYVPSHPATSTTPITHTRLPLQSTLSLSHDSISKTRAAGGSSNRQYVSGRELRTVGQPRKPSALPKLDRRSRPDGELTVQVDGNRTKRAIAKDAYELIRPNAIAAENAERANASARRGREEDDKRSREIRSPLRKRRRSLFRPTSNRFSSLGRQGNGTTTGREIRSKLNIGNATSNLDSDSDDSHPGSDSVSEKGEKEEKEGKKEISKEDQDGFPLSESELDGEELTDDEYYESWCSPTSSTFGFINTDNPSFNSVAGPSSPRPSSSDASYVRFPDDASDSPGTQAEDMGEGFSEDPLVLAGGWESRNPVWERIKPPYDSSGV
ncbi:hypothetical protein F5876DRAFT_82012 [Lentinula aff. lateritia]|uniref:Uncharacterized protein n=1 Tax=Lentinula aff. lateritia TaxID=2804960 RepID=A0ACC1TL46_9AGAR|nr:hypothetical protein F5876DRAFT_82012 [Lentinula aff. lateritia]